MSSYLQDALNLSTTVPPTSYDYYDKMNFTESTENSLRFSVSHLLDLEDRIQGHKGQRDKITCLDGGDKGDGKYTYFL